MDKPTNFEQAMHRIEEIVLYLEKGDIPLDNALAMFEEATGLTRKCESLLTKAEQKVTLLTKSEDNASDRQTQEVLENEQ